MMQLDNFTNRHYTQVAFLHYVNTGDKAKGENFERGYDSCCRVLNVLSAVNEPRQNSSSLMSLLHQSHNKIQRKRSSVFSTTAYGVDDRGIGVLVPVGSIIFIPPNSSDRNWGSPSPLTPGYRVPYSSGAKRKRREADH
jgi:hypothetical protein